MNVSLLFGCKVVILTPILGKRQLLSHRSKYEAQVKVKVYKHNHKQKQKHKFKQHYKQKYNHKYKPFTEACRLVLNNL